MKNQTLYLVKDNGDLCCHCECEPAFISFPPQMDCPWCGCGWLFTCTNCRKAFTFARSVEVNASWEELAHRDLDGKYGRDPTEVDIRGWIAAMQELHADVEPGQQYVCLDGVFIPTDAAGIEFQAWHSEHHLDFVPHVRACEDYSVKEEILSNRDYWLST